MASQHSLVNAGYDKSEGGSVDWKKKYLKMRRKYQEIMSSSDDDSSDDDSTQEYDHPAKKQCVNIGMDPLIKLDDDCLGELLKFLPPKDILNCMLLSTGWKTFIESRKVKMDRTMNQIVVKITSRDVEAMNERTFKQILTGDKRRYRHMSTDFALVRRTYNFAFIHHASTIESLELNCNCSLLDCEVPATDFPKLRNLVIECKVRSCRHELIENFIQHSSFPEVKSLKMLNFVPANSTANFFMNFPNLKALIFFPRNVFLYQQHQIQPGLEALCMNSPQTMVAGLKETLTELYLGSTSGSYLELLLNRLKKLKVLGIEWLDRLGGNQPLPQHETLSTLRIGSYSDRAIDRGILRALPALETLIVRSNVLLCLVRFIATEKRNLKRLICKSAASDTIDFHASLPNSTDEQFVNKNFELIFDADLKDYEQEFYSTKFI